MLPMSVARSSSGTLTIGRIAYWREEGDGSAQHGQSVIYIALFKLVTNWELWVFKSSIPDSQTPIKQSQLQDNLGELASERSNQSGFNEANDKLIIYLWIYT